MNQLRYLPKELCLVITVFTVISFNIFNYLYEKHPTPFIDEIFHIPQGMKYCNGIFSEWDTKITTLPGLYLVSFGVLSILEWILRLPMCSVYNLKLINILCSPLIILLSYSVLIQLDNKTTCSWHSRRALWTAFNIAIFPVSYMFNFFYYTDTMSTMFFLLMFLLHISKHFWFAAAFGFYSVIVRQTNIIWVGYFFLNLELEKIEHLKLNFYDLLNPQKFQALLQPLRLKELLHDGLGYLLVCMLFVIFVFVNGGVVVGDRSAHQPVLHLCQLFYFSLFSLVFAFPHFLSRINTFMKSFVNNYLISLLLLMLGAVIVHYFTMVHPYLLADNRHYSFYIWRRLFDKLVFMRYLLLPVYYFGLYCLNYSLRANSQLPYWICCTLCLVPQKLLELRYFITPFILFRLQLKCKSLWILGTESILFICINFATMYIFVTKQFYWQDSGDVQRIIW